MKSLSLLLMAIALIIAAPRPAEAAPKAELVGSATDDRMFLHGLLYSTDKPSRSVVINLPGGPGSFYSRQDMTPLAEALNRQGYNFLSFNTRSAGANGLFYTKFEDYLLDVAAAVKLAKSRGMTEIVLLGHSLGSVRAVYYLSQTKDPAVRALVLTGVITSPYGSGKLRRTPAEQVAYDAFLQTQRDAVKAGDGKRLSGYPWADGRLYEMSAATWVSIFGTPAESNASILKFAKDVTVPVLIVHGTKDEGALPANAPLVLASLVNSPDKSLVWTDGANHMFMGTADKYGRIISDWVVKTLPPKPAAP